MRGSSVSSARDYGKVRLCQMQPVEVADGVFLDLPVLDSRSTLICDMCSWLNEEY